MTDVSDAVKEQHKRASVGALGKMPADEGQETQSIGRAANRRETPEDFASIILRAEPDGRYVRLGDVAEITNGVRDMNYVSLQDGLETAAFSVALTNDANAVETIGQVNAILVEESRSFPPDMEYRTLVDSTRYVAESMKEVSNTFWEALALVVAIMYLFLRDPRATVIAVLTIPVSLIATFAAFRIAGFSINTLTLFAMVLAIGMVVDDAIVVIESVEQHLEKGGGIREATTAAMDALEEIAKEVAPTGFQIAWTGESRQLRDAQGTVLKVMGLSLLFVFLCLVALYESWSIPFSVLLSVPAGVFGALLTELAIGRAGSIYMQIGILMVIGLAAKNAILIAEFAKLRMDAGMKAVPAVFAAAKLRLRPILMPALTSIIGCLPLAFASGTGAEARVGMGAAVVGGMSAATILGLFFVPVLFALLARKKLR